jgi:hypothetical protein
MKRVKENVMDLPSPNITFLLIIKLTTNLQWALMNKLGVQRHHRNANFRSNLTWLRYETAPWNQDISHFTVAKTRAIRISRYHSSAEYCIYRGVSKSFRTGRLGRELQMVQLSAIRCRCIAILWVSLASFISITLSVASQQVFIVIVVYFVIDSARKLLDTPSHIRQIKFTVFTLQNSCLLQIWVEIFSHLQEWIQNFLTSEIFNFRYFK